MYLAFLFSIYVWKYFSYFFLLFLKNPFYAHSKKTTHFKAHHILSSGTCQMPISGGCFSFGAKSRRSLLIAGQRRGQSLSIAKIIIDYIINNNNNRNNNNSEYFINSNRKMHNSLWFNNVRVVEEQSTQIICYCKIMLKSYSFSSPFLSLSSYFYDYLSLFFNYKTMKVAFLFPGFFFNKFVNSPLVVTCFSIIYIS